MTRLSKERENILRGTSGAHNPIHEVLSEIDALRAENTTLKLERDCDLTSNTKTFYRGYVLIEENQKLRERVAKLRETIEFIANKTSFGSDPCAWPIAWEALREDKALAQDDEMEKNDQNSK